MARPPRQAPTPQPPGNRTRLASIPHAAKNFAGSTRRSTSGIIRGAERAYAIILEAFAAGDRRALRPLLAPDVLTAFEGAIAARLERRETLSLTLVGTKQARIVDVAATAAGMAVTVRFVAEIVSSTCLPDGTVTDGDPGQVIETSDLWTFEPDPASAGRAWLVTATEGG